MPLGIKRFQSISIGALGVVGWAFSATAVRGDKPGLPPEVRQVQESLGGPEVNHYEQLQPQLANEAAADSVLVPSESGARTAPTPGWGQTSPAPWPHPTPAYAAPTLAPATAPASGRPMNSPVAALRGTAIQLEHGANQFENLQLYEHADAMRDLAQRLRVDARTLVAETERPERGRTQPAPVSAIHPPIGDGREASNSGSSPAGLKPATPTSN